MSKRIALSIGVLAFALSMIGASNSDAARRNKLSNIKWKPAKAATKPPKQDYPSEKEITALGKMGRKHNRAPSASGSLEGRLTDEYKAFRDRLLKVRTADGLRTFFLNEDKAYRTGKMSDPARKYMWLRLRPTMYLSGYIWKMTPVVKQVVMPHEILLGMVRGMAEQIALREDKTHAMAFLQYVNQPASDDLRQWHYVSDVQNFFEKDLFPALDYSAEHIRVLVKSGVLNKPVIMDMRLRFGEQVGTIPGRLLDVINPVKQSYLDITDQQLPGSAYEDRDNLDLLPQDQYRYVSTAEALAAIARIYRRMAMIAQFISYDMNGHLAVRTELGKKIGINDTLFPPVDGVTRRDRVKFVTERFPNVYKLRDNGEYWMQRSFRLLNLNVRFLKQTWNILKNRKDNDFWALDPVVFQGRSREIDSVIESLSEVTGIKGGSNPVAFRGSLSGEIVIVDLEKFYTNPPNNLQNLLPTKFQGHEDIFPNINKAVSEGKITKPSDSKHGTMDKINLTINGKKVTIRNYLYGRSIGWNVSHYKNLFPMAKKPEDIGKFQRILNESRGGRIVANSLLPYLR